MNATVMLTLPSAKAARRASAVPSGRLQYARTTDAPARLADASARAQMAASCLPTPSAESRYFTAAATARSLETPAGAFSRRV